ALQSLHSSASLPAFIPRAGPRSSRRLTHCDMNREPLKQLARGKHTAQIGEAFSLALGAINQHRFQSALTLTGLIMGVATVIVVVALIQGLDNTIKSALSRLNPSSFVIARAGFSDFGNPDFMGLLPKRPPLVPDDAKVVR